jgi:hypothetical protein
VPYDAVAVCMVASQRVQVAVGWLAGLLLLLVLVLVLEPWAGEGIAGYMPGPSSGFCGPGSRRVWWSR